MREIDINEDRLAESLWRLVNVPSPTGQERKVVLAYADMLAEAGAEVELDEFVPESPAVTGRLRGDRPGKCLQLAGHIDHIHAPHPAPARDYCTLSGRGCADMKSGLAGILEVVATLNESGRDFPGELLVTAYGQHESPWGSHAPLLHLLESGFRGDAAIVVESFVNKAVVAAKGQAIWNITLRRDGGVCHELYRTPEMDNLLLAAMTLTETLRAKHAALQQTSDRHPTLTPDSLFVGQLHYGDFYNRAPNECALQGTYRWRPSRSFEEVQADMTQTLDMIDFPKNVSRQLSWILSGDSYEVAPDEQIIRSLTDSHLAVTGTELEIGGTAVITDACRLVRNGGIPTAVLDFDSEHAHADYEFVRLDEVRQACRILLATVLDYLSTTATNG